MSTAVPAAAASPATPTSTSSFIAPEAVREHWQGHRRLTRRLLEAFPEDQLYSYSIGGMRTFGVLVGELLSMAEPMVRGTLTNEWNTSWDREEKSKADLLRAWDASTEQIDTLWAQIPAERFHEHLVAFGQYPGPAHDLILYCIDNEVHHRGQGYVYLRALGVEPPPFWERA